MILLFYNTTKMLIRSFQRRDMRKKRFFTAIWIGILIILVWIGGNSIRNYYKQQHILPAENLKIWQIITFEGNIRSTNKFPIYTHTIQNKDGIKAYLKSSDINLNTYEKEDITLKGTISDIYKGTPLIEVNEVRIVNEGLALNDNVYMFSKDFLLLDFKNQNQLSAKRTEREIEVYYGEKKIFTIERFVCSKIYKNWNCDQLIDEYEIKQKDSFTSYRGYTYYKHGTGLWTVFDGNKFWYIFKDIDDSLLLDISSNIRMIDPELLIDTQWKEISKTCGFTKITMWTIKEKEEDTISAIFEGKDQNDKEKWCTVSFDTKNGLNIIDTNDWATNE